MSPVLVMLAGPNGAGKSTFYEAYLTSSLPFLNADLIAADAGIDSLAAARLLDSLRDRMIDEGDSFVTESVFSDPGGVKLAMLGKAVAAGFDVTLIYIGIADPILSADRVAQRVAHGGHDVPSEKLAARFERSLANLAAAIGVVPKITIYDNSLATDPYRLVAVIEKQATTFRVTKLPRWLKGIRLPPKSRKR